MTMITDIEARIEARERLDVLGEKVYSQKERDADATELVHARIAEEAAVRRARIELEIASGRDKQINEEKVSRIEPQYYAICKQIELAQAAFVESIRALAKKHASALRTAVDARGVLYGELSTAKVALGEWGMMSPGTEPYIAIKHATESLREGIAEGFGK